MAVVHLVSGLPRAGSTILLNILGQNPRFKVGGTSGLADMMLEVRRSWGLVPEFRAMPAGESDDRKRRTLNGMVRGYHSAEGKPVIFNKSRVWLSHIDMYEAAMGYKVKILVPIRDVREILASFELLWRKAAPLRQIPTEFRNYFEYQSIAGRCNVLMKQDGFVGVAYNRLRDAFLRGYADRLHLIRYEQLVVDPVTVMQGVYDFLGEQWFPSHDFYNIEPLVQEDDEAYGFPGLHATRRELEARPAHWPEVIGQEGDKYGFLNDFFAPKERENDDYIPEGLAWAEDFAAPLPLAGEETPIEPTASSTSEL